METIDKSTQLMHALQALPENDKGPSIAMACNWCGDDIFAIMLGALTDANFHPEVAALRKTWDHVATLQNLKHQRGG